MIGAGEGSVPRVQRRERRAGDGVEPQAQLSVGGKRLDWSLRVCFARERLAKQIEKQVELDSVQAAQRGEAQGLVARKAVARAGDLRRLFSGERRKQRLCVGAIDDGTRTAAGGVAAGLPQSWNDAQRRAREPARAGGFAGRFN